MKKVLILLSLLLLTGCAKSNEQMEYIFFKSSADRGTVNRAFNLTYNEWISDETIEKLKKDPEIEVDAAYMFIKYYEPNGIDVDEILGWPLDWHLILNGVEIRNKDTGLYPCTEQAECVGQYQYFGIAPFKNMEELKNRCVKRYIGEVKKGCIPMYVGENYTFFTEEIDNLEENYNDEFLIQTPVMTPIGMHDGIYDMKVISLTFQVVGYYDTPNCIYQYISLDDMNRIVQENAESEIKPMDYIITTNEKKAKQIRKMEDSLYLYPRWTNQLDPFGNTIGLIDENTIY